MLVCSMHAAESVKSIISTFALKKPSTLFPNFPIYYLFIYLFIYLLRFTIYLYVYMYCDAASLRISHDLSKNIMHNMTSFINQSYPVC